MTTRYVLSLGSACALVLAMSGCGGGGGSSGTTTGASGSNSVASMVSGPVTAFGSVFVNGTEFDTTRTTFVDDDAPNAVSSASDLDVGMIVDIKTAGRGAGSLPMAGEIHFSALARGTVEAVDCTAGTMQVMGQPVALTSATVFHDARAVPPNPPVTSCTGVAVGDFVGVHGYLAQTGTNATQIVATLIRERDFTQGTTLFKVEGPIASVSGTTFIVNGLTIDDSSARCQASLMTNCSGIAVGQYVAILGPNAPSGTNPETFSASVVRLKPRLAAQVPGSSVEVEGVVAGLSGTSFDLRGLAVDASTVPAATLALLSNGAVVEVTGTISPSGSGIVATDIVIRREAQLIVEADLEAINHSTGADSIQVLGQSFMLDANTRFVDLVSNVRPFNIGNYYTVLTAGGSTPDHVVVRAGTGSGGATATVVVRVPASATTAIAGIADAVTNPATQTQLTIQGIPVTIGAGTAFWPPHRYASVTDFLTALQTAQAPNGSGQPTRIVYLLAIGKLASGMPEGVDATTGTLLFRANRFDVGPN